MSKWDILGIGDTDVDIFLRVDHLPGHDEKVVAELIGEVPGGMVANFCSAAGRLGARTALVSVVGDDRYGHAAIADLAAHDVDVSLVAMRPGGRTYFCIVHLDGSGEKALSVVVTDCISPSIDQVREVDLGQARLVHLAANELDLALWTARQAKERGATVMLDIESSASSRDRPNLLRILRFVDIAAVNASGYEALIGGSASLDPAEILRFGPRTALVTLGARGCVAATATETASCPGFPVEAVDTTGAGDCFNAAFAVSQLRGWTLQRGVEFAAAAAAISIGRVGGHAAAPSMAEVTSFLAGRGFSQASRAFV